MSLVFLSKNEHLSDLATTFGISEVVAKGYLNDVVKLIAFNYNTLEWRNYESQLQMIKTNQRNGLEMPNVIISMDGTSHFRRKPYLRQYLYYCGEKKKHCIQTLLFSERSTGILLHADIGYPGNNNDITNWLYSAINTPGQLHPNAKISTDRLFPRSDSRLYSGPKQIDGESYKSAHELWSRVHNNKERVVNRLKRFVVR
eukprot:TRINITY_DN1195_c0_g1_i3.p1 TRINITY_DN1195_c0_g1~~TRINITY_DN1195_c0_g1_i3.p1  ORF type:complete len:200 (-),score=21.41 TRINITY_DN1195_c0_g1_i3:209-808(-)